MFKQHDWLTVLRGVLGPSGVDMQRSSVVAVVAPDYFSNLSSVISSASLVNEWVNIINSSHQTSHRIVIHLLVCTPLLLTLHCTYV